MQIHLEKNKKKESNKYYLHINRVKSLKLSINNQ